MLLHQLFGGKWWGGGGGEKLWITKWTFNLYNFHCTTFFVEQGFSINFLQGPNCFVQNAEGPHAQNRPPPPPLKYEFNVPEDICAYWIRRVYRCRNSKMGSFGVGWAENGVILCETAQTCLSLIPKN